MKYEDSDVYGGTRTLRLLALWLVTFSLAFGAAAFAGESGPSDEDSLRKAWPSEGPQGELFHDIASSLRCPTCTGLSVLDSDARFSQQIKEIVMEQVTAGKSREQILQFFTERYGPWILRAPPAKGFNIVAWLLPLSILVLGPPGVWFFVWRRRRVVNTQGVRSGDDIIKEMHERLEGLRS